MSGYSDVLGTEPGRVAAPDSPESVAQTVFDASAKGEGLVVWGGGTAQGYGYAPNRADVLLETSHLNRIIAVEAGDLTISVQAGATLSAVQNVLGEHGLFLPLDAENASTATMGGILATAAHGAARTGYGVVRDSLIGLTVADAQGNLVKSGGNVVKNVTGYDLPKLHTGALGTLGVIVSANFKVAPLPEASESFLFTLPDGERSAAFLDIVRATTAPIVALIRTRGTAAILLLVYAGFREAVADDVEKATQAARMNGAGAPASGTAETIAAFLAPPETPLRIRVSTVPMDSLTLHENACAIFGVMETRTSPFIGQTDIFALTESDLPAIYDTAAKLADAHKAALTVLHAPLSMRQGGFELWRPLPPSFPLMRRLKATLDPHNTLNAGRFIGGL